MKYISFFFFLMFFSCCENDILQQPEYILIKNFSGHVKKETGMNLWIYAINDYFPRQNLRENSVADFYVSYGIHKTRNDTISLDEARCLILSISESFLNAINKDEKVRDKLDTYPFSSDRLAITLHFVDENDIDLGNGSIESVRLSKDRVKYKKYDIEEYNPPIAFGTHYVVHEESYAEALEIVKQQGCLRLF